MSEADLLIENWDPSARYEFGFGAGFYLGSHRQVTRKGVLVEVPVNVEKQMAIFDRTLKQMADMAMMEGGAPFLIVDDHSPVPLDPQRCLKQVGGNPFLFVRLPRNIGCGGKENILQRVLSERCEYVVRFDADATFHDISLNGIRLGFNTLDDAYAITSCITYFARLYAATLPDDQRWFSGSNIADLAVYRSSVLDVVGYSDPEIRYNDDGEHRLRILAATGRKVYVDRQITGKAPPSGAGSGLDARLRAAKYIERTRPFIRVSYPKNNGTPRLTFNKKRASEAQGFRVPGHPLAEKLAAVAWE